MYVYIYMYIYIYIYTHMYDHLQTSTLANAVNAVYPTLANLGVSNRLKLIQQQLQTLFE